MTNIFNIFILTMLGSHLVGCSTLDSPVPDQSNIATDSVSSVTAALSQTHVRGKTSDYRICSQPPPDAAFDQSEGGSVNISMIGRTTDSASDNEGSNDVEMSGRSPGVLIAREMFFRACEFSTNFNLSSDEATKVYLETLDKVAQGWASESAHTTITVGDSLAIKASLLEKLSQTLLEPTTPNTSDAAATSD